MPHMLHNLNFSKYVFFLIFSYKNQTENLLKKDLTLLAEKWQTGMENENLTVKLPQE